MSEPEAPRPEREAGPAQRLDAMSVTPIAAPGPEAVPSAPPQTPPSPAPPPDYWNERGYSKYDGL